jgi:DNA repair exonuclease SbcCD ATPase subunit
MKVLTIVVVALFVSCVAAIQLPPGFNSASDIASVLAAEPESAHESRFEEVNAPAADTVAFKDSTTSGSSNEDDEGDAEYDAQIEQIEADIKKLKENIKESEECARRLNEQNAELRSLEDQKDHVEKEKEKRVLQLKLEKQMRDLEEINKMSRSLRTKFAELKRTQKVIVTKMSGTRTSLSQLENEDDGTTVEDLNQNTVNLGQEVASMQSTQEKILANSHVSNVKAVQNNLNQAMATHKQTLADGVY